MESKIPRPEKVENSEMQKNTEDMKTPVESQEQARQQKSAAEKKKKKKKKQTPSAPSRASPTTLASAGQTRVSLQYLSPSRGFGLFSLVSVPAGSCLFVDFPAAFAQANSALVPACEECLTTIGLWEEIRRRGFEMLKTLSVQTPEYPPSFPEELFSSCFPLPVEGKFCSTKCKARAPQKPDNFNLFLKHKNVERNQDFQVAASGFLHFLQAWENQQKSSGASGEAQARRLWAFYEEFQSTPWSKLMARQEKADYSSRSDFSVSPDAERPFLLVVSSVYSLLMEILQPPQALQPVLSLEAFNALAGANRLNCAEISADFPVASLKERKAIENFLSPLPWPRLFARGLFLIHSKMNHACAGAENAVVKNWGDLDKDQQEEARRQWASQGEALREAGDLQFPSTLYRPLMDSQPDSAPSALFLFSRTAISAGDELFIDYIKSSGFSYGERQAALRRFYGFDCSCKICQTEKT